MAAVKGPRVMSRLRALLPVALVLGLVTEVHAEDVSERAKVASSGTRLRGAAALKVIPGGLRIGVDIGAGRESFDVSLATIEKGARALR
jgi:hypothetical protein